MITLFMLRNITFRSISIDFKKLSICLFNLMFWSSAILGVIKSCTCSYTRTLRFLIPRSCAYLDSLGKFGFRAKSGFKNKCRAGFGLQNEARLQLC